MAFQAPLAIGRHLKCRQGETRIPSGLVGGGMHRLPLPLLPALLTLEDQLVTCQEGIVLYFVTDKEFQELGRRTDEKEKPRKILINSSSIQMEY